MLMPQMGSSSAKKFALSTMQSAVRFNCLSLMRYDSSFAARELARVYSVSEEEVINSTVLALIEHSYHGDDVAVLGFIVCDNEKTATAFATDWKQAGSTDDILKS